MAGKTILIIEDDAIQRERLATELRQQGFGVVSVSEGNEAMKNLANAPVPDLILLDMLIRGGGGDGWWFLKQRQHVPMLASVPVLIMTSLSVASEAWAASLGAVGLVRPPLDATVLLAEVRRCLGESD